jgi:protocatechuate 3,4-dioxygenase beta subunit
MPRSQGNTTVAAIFLVLCLGFSLAWGQNDVLTQHNDNTRSGLNANETLLTPANVNVNGFGKLFTQNVDGMIVGQPLYANQVLMDDGLVHNVVYVATQNNTVYAFDADSTQGNNAYPLWAVNLDDGGTPDPISDYGCTGTHYTEIGIMGTPVIDPSKTTLYVVAKTITGTGSTAVRNFSLHALDITSGNEVLGGPAIITGTAPSKKGLVTFNPVYQMQRPALLLENGVVYIGFGGNGCDLYAYNGWLFAYSAQTLRQQSAFLITPNGKRGSLWQGGSGPAADEAGYIYVATANGTYDSSSDYGDSVLKMGWNGNVLSVMDFFTPYNQAQLAQQDLDLGSSGPLLLPDQPGLYPHELVAGGKQGTLYLVNRDNQGQFVPQTDNVIQEIPKTVVGELNGVPTYWNSNVYVAGEGDHIKQFTLVNGLLTQQPISQTALAFTGSGPASTSMTANGNTNGILWAIRHTTQALFAFDATNLANEFWDSTQAPKSRDKLVPVVRFVTPTISNGKVYVGGSAALEVYGLLPALAVVGGNNQTGVESAVLPVPLTVAATDAYASAPLAGVVITCKDGGVGGVFSPSATQTTNSSGTATYTYQLPTKPEAVTITCTSPGYPSLLFSETCTTGPPVALKISSGNNQTAPPTAPLAALLVLNVVDVHSYGVSGVTVNFTDNGAGGTFVATSVVTGSKGTASAQYTMGPHAGKVTITASSTGLKSVSFTATAVVGPAANISVASGNNQSGTVATKLTQALTALVTDSYNNPVSGVSVTFSDGAAGGTFSNPNPIVTGTNGTASQFYTLPTLASAISITATAAGVSSPAPFTETSVAGPATGIAVTEGNNQSGAAGTKLTQALTARVTDQYNNPASGINVSFSDGGALGAFSNPNPGVTNSSGTVTQSYTLPPVTGTITITAAATGISNPAVFVESSLPGPAAIVAIVSGNSQSATAGTQLPQALTVVVTDQFGNPVPNVSVNFSDGGAGGTFYNPNPGVTGASGQVSQTYLLPTTAGTIPITATASGVANPAVFTETSVAGNAVNIVITNGNNQTGTAGTQLLQALTVQVADQYTNPVAGVSVTFDDGGAGGVFSNPNPVATDNTGSSSQLYTLPPTPGTVTITATVAGIANPAVFTETGQ